MGTCMTSVTVNFSRRTHCFPLTVVHCRWPSIMMSSKRLIPWVLTEVIISLASLHVALYTFIGWNNLNIGCFYYLLGNIEPRLRSVLRCIQLIACVTMPNLQKYGFEMVLKPFIEDANTLSKVSLF